MLMYLFDCVKCSKVCHCIVTVSTPTWSFDNLLIYVYIMTISDDMTIYNSYKQELEYVVLFLSRKNELSASLRHILFTLII